LLDRFAHSQYLFSGGNKGVHARNDGFDAARGEFVILLDDDVMVETPAMLDLFAARFAEDERLGAITVSKHVRGETRRRVDLIPHTRKDVDLTSTFLTFRFVGGCVAFRTACLREVGGFLPDFFYGLEEIELSYRIIDAGWRIRYDPAVSCEELEHPAGRDAKKRVQTQRLANKYIISYLRMPFPEVLVNAALFTPYLLLRQRGQASVAGAVKQFMAWRSRADRPTRKAISRDTAAYIRACGGSVWR
jgi:GT2 family glycosyltransferase